jgi:hypothetical protein
MPTIQKTNAGGRPARLGRVYFVNDKMHFHAGYAKVGDDNVRILYTPDEWRQLGTTVGMSKTPMGARLARRLMRHYNL